jgi:hypothetical protein
LPMNSDLPTSCNAMRLWGAIIAARENCCEEASANREGAIRSQNGAKRNKIRSWEDDSEIEQVQALLVRSALNRMRSPGLTLFIPLTHTLNGYTQSGPLAIRL